MDQMFCRKRRGNSAFHEGLSLVMCGAYARSGVTSVSGRLSAAPLAVMRHLEVGALADACDLRPDEQRLRELLHAPAPGPPSHTCANRRNAVNFAQYDTGSDMMDVGEERQNPFARNDTGADIMGADADAGDGLMDMAAALAFLRNQGYYD